MLQLQDSTITRIRTFPEDEKALRTPATVVETITHDVFQFARDLCEWMRREGGLGLAATQVETTLGTTPALFAMARGTEDIVFVNPVIEKTGGLAVEEEGCLSFGSLLWAMPAPDTVRVRFLDLSGASRVETFRGFAARCVAHETDHLKGKLMIDRMLRRDRKRFLERLAEPRRG